jgi:type I restriction enzyme S subunit
MFGEIILNKNNYPLKKFGDVCDELFLGLTSKVDYVESGGYPLVRTTDINNGVLSLKNVKFISEEQHKKVTARRITKRGDLLMSKSGTLGTCAIVDTDIEFSTYESIFTIRPKKTLLNNIFLISLIRNSSFQEKLLGGKVGAGVAHLNLNMLRDFIFPLPPIELQKQFSKLLNNSYNQQEITKNINRETQTLFNTLMDQLFS